jgi:TusA-related sulfurtransferase
MINIKVVRVPGAVVEVVLDDGATVADALQHANITVDAGESLKVNTDDATLATVLVDGARVILSKAAKGNRS